MIVLFFKQKSAYEMRISDWSSDVCSSDLSLASYRAARPLRLVGKKAMSVPVDARCQGRRAGEGGTPARRPSAILRVELRGGELQKLDRFRVAHRAAHPLAGIEVDERLVRERVAQDLRFRPLGDQIADRKSTRLNSS